MSSFTVTKVVSKRTGRVSWVARWDYLDDDGRRVHRKKSFRTRDAAREHRDTVAGELRGGTYSEPVDITTGDWLRQWVATVGANRAPSTVHTYRQAVRLRYGAIDRIPLARLKRSHLESLLAGWQAEGLSSQTRASAFRILRTALRRAIDDGLIKTDPSANVEPPKIERARPAVWSAGQMQAFLSATDEHRDGLLFRFILLTLMREGEVAALDWDDVDLVAGTITVRRTLQRRADGSWGISERPKSAHGLRMIPLGPDLVQRLRDHRDEQERRRAEFGVLWVDDGCVFDRGNGERQSAASLRHRWQTITARLDLPPLTIHGLRHSGATELARRGVALVALQQLLGHHSSRFTADTYVHPLEDERREAATLLETVTANDARRLRVLKGTG